MPDRSPGVLQLPEVPPGPDPPTVSVIVPTHNRPTQLATCLQALARQDYPRERLEVVVVDDGSPHPPRDVVAALRDRLDVSLLSQPRAGPGAARNAGARPARGAVLAFTDDDCAPAPDWLRRLTARLATIPGRNLVGGCTLNALADNPYSATSQLIHDFANAHYNADPNRAGFFAASNLALPAEGFGAVGGFDPSFVTSEDRDLCDRWLRHGYRLLYAPDAVVYHAHPLTLRSFWRQHFAYGRGAFRFHHARARRGAGPFRPEPRFYLTLLRYLVSRVREAGEVPLAGRLVVWQSANTAGFLWEWAMGAGRRRHPARG